MASIGILLIVLGFGSLALEYLNLGIEFRIMSLLADYQPWAGIVVGLIGLALLLAPRFMRREEPVAPPATRQDHPADPQVRRNLPTDQQARRDLPTDPQTRQEQFPSDQRPN